MKKKIWDIIWISAVSWLLIWAMLQAINRGGGLF